MIPIPTRAQARAVIAEATAVYESAGDEFESTAEVLAFWLVEADRGYCPGYRRAKPIKPAQLPNLDDGPHL